MSLFVLPDDPPLNAVHTSLKTSIYLKVLMVTIGTSTWLVAALLVDKVPNLPNRVFNDGGGRLKLRVYKTGIVR